MSDERKRSPGQGASAQQRACRGPRGHEAGPLAGGIQARAQAHATCKALDPRLTEQRNPRSTRIDRLSTIEIVDLINAEDRMVAAAVGESASRSRARSIWWCSACARAVAWSTSVPGRPGGSACSTRRRCRPPTAPIPKRCRASSRAAPKRCASPGRRGGPSGGWRGGDRRKERRRKRLRPGHQRIGHHTLRAWRAQARARTRRPYRLSAVHLPVRAAHQVA